MKRLLLSMFAFALVFLMATGNAYAESGVFSWLPIFGGENTSDSKWISQLESEILPQLDTIFTPTQREKFKTDITNGVTFRKAFKSLALSPDQKTQLKDLLKSVSKKDAFAALTPDQKKKLFLKKKEMFMPTSEEIGEKIDAGIKAKGSPLPEGVKEKIDANLKKKEMFMPTPEEITEKIEMGMKMKEKMAD